MAYTADDFERQVTAMKPRFIDIWVVPPLIMYSAWKAKDLGRWTRRVLFTAGVYMLYRNFTEYKSAVAAVAALVPEKGQGAAPLPSEETTA